MTAMQVKPDQLATTEDSRPGFAVAPAEFRRVMSHIPTAVAVVTGYVDGRPAGLAVGTFTSISLEPPLVGFFPSSSSSSWPGIREHGRFCVNVLTEDQHDLSQRFARSGDDKFAGLDVDRAPHGTGPMFRDAVAVVECRVESELPVGDHSLVVGAVLAMCDGGGRRPLVFHRGRYAALQP